MECPVINAQPPLPLERDSYLFDFEDSELVFQLIRAYQTYTWSLAPEEQKAFRQMIRKKEYKLPRRNQVPRSVMDHHIYRTMYDRKSKSWIAERVTFANWALLVISYPSESLRELAKVVVELGLRRQPCFSIYRKHYGKRTDENLEDENSCPLVLPDATELAHQCKVDVRFQASVQTAAIDSRCLSQTPSENQPIPKISSEKRRMSNDVDALLEVDSKRRRCNLAPGEENLPGKSSALYTTWSSAVNVYNSMQDQTSSTTPDTYITQAPKYELCQCKCSKATAAEISRLSEAVDELQAFKYFVEDGFPAMHQVDESLQVLSGNTEQTAEYVKSFSTKVEAAAADQRETVKTIREDLENLKQTFTSHMKQKVSIRKDLEQIKSIEKKLDSRLQKLEERLDQLNHVLEEKIESKIQDCEDKMQCILQNLEDKLYSNIQDLEDKMDGDIQAHRDATTSSQKKLKKSVDEHTKAAKLAREELGALRKECLANRENTERVVSGTLSDTLAKISQDLKSV